MNAVAALARARAFRLHATGGPVTAAVLLLLRTCSSPPPGGWTPVVAIAGAATVGVAVRTRRRDVLTNSFRISAADDSHGASHPFAPPPTPPPPPPRPPQTTERTLSIPADLETDVWNRTTSARGLPPSLPTYWELNGDILINSYRTVYKYRTPPPGPSTRVPAVNIAARAPHYIIYFIIRHMYTLKK